jgi:hypothetical protein
LWRKEGKKEEYNEGKIEGDWKRKNSGKISWRRQEGGTSSEEICLDQG